MCEPDTTLGQANGVLGRRRRGRRVSFGESRGGAEEAVIPANPGSEEGRYPVDQRRSRHIVASARRNWSLLGRLLYAKS
uniref:Uncharacterized protein n=1 Tax=Rhizophora mucronata TaxID=61149 RepID=A0A2P2IUQ1_RHIMU